MTDDVTLRMVELPDGGVLEVGLANWATTPDDAPVVVDLHGTPGCGRSMSAYRAAAAARGVRVVAPSRAGYGTSSPNPGRSVASVAADVAAVLDALGVGRVMVVGTSGGGPHALATAAGLPDRVTAVASVAGVGPYGAVGLDFLAGMGQDNIDEFGAAVQGEGPLRSYLDAQRAALAGVTADQLAAGMASLLPPPDLAVLTGAFADDLVEHFTHGLSEGIEGWLEDDLAFVAPWGFELSDLRCPVSVWQGSADLMVPAAHGAWLTAHLPGVTAHLLEGEGHLSIAVGKAGEIFDELLAGHAAAPVQSRPR